MDYIKELPENVEVTLREGNEKKFRFVFNDTDKEQKFALSGTEIHLDPFEMQITEIPG